MVNRIETQIINLYEYAKNLVQNSGYREYIHTLTELLEKKPYKTIDSSKFLREYTWVVFSCGFKADTVRKYWSEIQKMLFNFNVKKIRKLTFEEMLNKCPIKNERKVTAIYKTCRDLDKQFLAKIAHLDSEKEAKELFKSLPFIGDITVFHIMRNLGIDCYKPDRHIKNLAKTLGIEEKKIFNILLSKKKVKYVGIADFILWRASACLNSAQKLVEYAQKDLDLEKIDNVVQAEEEVNSFLF
ncbi:MAG: hypothetical protein R6U96_02240 [Promethearchaeia archaeon]